MDVLHLGKGTRGMIYVSLCVHFEFSSFRRASAKSNHSFPLAICVSYMTDDIKKISEIPPRLFSSGVSMLVMP